MAEIGGQLGNKNATKNKPWADALRKALAQYEDADTKPGEALFKIAQHVVIQALKGDRDCIQEIANRQDGKVAQSLSLNNDDECKLVFAAIRMVVVRPE